MLKSNPLWRSLYKFFVLLFCLLAYMLEFGIFSRCHFRYFYIPVNLVKVAGWWYLLLQLSHDYFLLYPLPNKRVFIFIACVVTLHIYVQNWIYTRARFHSFFSLYVCSCWFLWFLLIVWCSVRCIVCLNFQSNRWYWVS